MPAAILPILTDESRSHRQECLRKDDLASVLGTGLWIQLSWIADSAG